MTLVVGQRTSDGVALCADGLLALPAEPRTTGYASTALKLLLVHPGLCIGFAGGAEDAVRAIARLAITPGTGFDPDRVVEALLRAHKNSRGNTDFLIGSLLPTPTLLRISHGEAVVCDQTFVGSARAFSVYREKQGRLTGDTSRDAASSLEEAMEALVESDDFPEVGGFQVGVATYQRGLEYRPPYGTIASGGGVLEGGTPPGTHAMPIPRTAEAGGFRQVFAVPKESGIGAMASYMNPGDIGHLWLPGERLEPFVYNQVSQDEFSRRVRKDHRIELEFHGRLDKNW